MSSGHTNRGGRQGNSRRARHGPSRQQNSTNGGEQRAMQATSLMASSERAVPFQAPQGATNSTSSASNTAAQPPQSAASVTRGERSGNLGRSESRSDKRTPLLVPPAASARLTGAIPAAEPQTESQGDFAGADEDARDATPSQHHEKPFAVMARPPRAESVVPGEHPPLRPEVRGDVGALIDSLHDLFAQDRAVASQGGTTRCGICYLHFPLGELEYREIEGFYICKACLRALGAAPLPMVRRQQRI